jgi:hypothetical protein
MTDQTEIIRVSHRKCDLVATAEDLGDGKCLVWVTLYWPRGDRHDPECAVVGTFDAPFEWHQVSAADLNGALHDALANVHPKLAKVLRAEFAKHVR